MPRYLTAWAANSILSARALNEAMYSVDGTMNTPTGVLFLAQRPIALQGLAQTVTIPASSAGITTQLYGAQGQGQMVMDSAGLYGQWTDGPGGLTTYSFDAAVVGSTGTMPTTGSTTGTLTAGGWMWLHHVAAVNPSSTGIVCGAGMGTTAGFLNSGSRQAIEGSRDNSPFYLDLVNTNSSGTSPTSYRPNVYADDSSTVNWTTRTSASDGSGEQSRFFALWAASAFGSYGVPASPPGTAATVWTPTTAITSTIANTDIRGTLNYLSHVPILRVYTTTSQSVTTGTATKLTGLTTVSIDNYSGYSTSTSTYTVPRAGLYLVHALICWQATGTGGTGRMTGVGVNGSIYWGPGYAWNTGLVYTTKTQIFSLNVGDTVTVYGWQNSGSTGGFVTTDETRLSLSWLCESGAPLTLWTPPDPSFRWTAGTPGNMLAAQFLEHVGNDIGYLVQPPYFLGYQTTAQTGIANGAWVTITLDTVQGIVHADAGDTYSGWSATSHWYAAPRSGWYLVVGETAISAATVSASVVVGLLVSTSGGVTPVTSPDWYQHMLASTQSGSPPGATAVGLYYLAQGEHVALQTYTQDYAAAYSTITGTVTGGTMTSHMEIIWVSD